MDGLKGAQAAIERLRNFSRRLDTESLPSGSNPEIVARSEQAIREFEAAMDDDLNTAQALAAVFEYIRDVNTKIDTAQFQADNATDARRVLDLFDSIFDVLHSEQDGKIAADEIEKLIAQRTAARRNKDFALADKIRTDLIEAGVILEDGRGGTSWHYAE